MNHHNRTSLNRQQYFVFRFEDSLRKYAPEPRKLVKLSHGRCQYCQKKDESAMRSSRIHRICDTRRKYYMQSREKASQYSKKKGREKSVDQKRLPVSQFLFGSYEKQISQSKAQRNCIVSALKQHPDLSHLISEEKDRSGKLKSQYEEPEADMQNQAQQKENEMKFTPFKRKIQIQLCEEQKEIEQQMIALEHKKQNLVKDIDFHIQLVTQLHSKFIYGEHSFSEPISCPDKNGDIVRIQSDIINTPKGSSCQNFSDCQEQQKEFFLGDDRMEQGDDGMEQGGDGMEQEEIDRNLSVLEKQQEIISQQMQDYQQKSLQHLESQVHPRHKNQRLLKFLQQNSKVYPTRIKLQTNKGNCFLSTRVLYKICKLETTNPNELTLKLIKRHPYVRPYDIEKITSEVQVHLRENSKDEILQQQQNDF